MKNENIQQVFESWLGNCMHGSIGDHVTEMAGNFQAQPVDESIQLSWFDNKDWTAVRQYNGVWYKTASLRLIKEAPADVVLNYLFYCSPIDTEKQIALIERDIREKTHLSRNYFHIFCACPQAQKQIMKYDKDLWLKVLYRNYAWDWKYEKMFGSTAKAKEKIFTHFEELSNCNFEEIPEALEKIA